SGFRSRNCSCPSSTQAFPGRAWRFRLDFAAFTLTSPLPMARRSIRSSTLLLALAPLPLLAACSPNDSGPPGVTFNLCAPLVVTPDSDAPPDQLDGISRAEALWNTLAGAQLSLPAAGAAGAAAASVAALPLHFQRAAGNFHGLYDNQTVQVFINLD